MENLLLSKYFKFKDGYSILNKLQLKVSDAYEFNDPFEFDVYLKDDLTEEEIVKAVTNKDWLVAEYQRNVKLREKFAANHKVYTAEGFANSILMHSRDIQEKQKYLKKKTYADMFVAANSIKKVISDGGKILCLVDDKSLDELGDILMWSHYADGHEGIKIYFDSTKLETMSTFHGKLNYDLNKPETSMKTYFNDNKINVSISDLVLTKGKMWEYESEYRMLFKKDIVKLIGNEKGIPMYGIDLPKECIVGVGIGCKCMEENVDKVLCLIDTKYNNINLYRVDKHLRSYSLKYVKLN